MKLETESLILIPDYRDLIIIEIQGNDLLSRDL